MNTTNQLTPKQRLLRIAKFSPLLPRALQRRNYLTIFGLLLFVLSILVIAWLGGKGAGEIFRQYSERIQEMSSAFWR